MDSKDQPQYNLDADILQCKADIQKALGPVSAPSVIKQPSPPVADLPGTVVKPSSAPEISAAVAAKSVSPQPAAPSSTVRASVENPVEAAVLSIEDSPKDAVDTPPKTTPKATAVSRLKVSAKNGKKRLTEPAPEAEPALKDEIAVLRSELEKIASELELRKNAGKDDENRLALALGDIQKNAQALSALQTAAGRIQQGQPELAKAVEQTKIKIQRLGTDLSATQDAYSRHIANWAEWQVNLTKQLSSLERQDQRTSALEERLTKTPAMLDNLRNDFHDGLRQHNLMLSDFEKRLSRLSEKPSQPQDLEPLKSQLTELKKQQDALALRVEKNASVRSGLETLSNRLQATEKHLDGLNETGVQTQRQIEKIHEKLSDYISAIDRIERKLQETQPVQLSIPQTPVSAIADSSRSEARKQAEVASVPQFSLDEQTMAKPRRKVSAGREGPAHRLSPDHRDPVRAVVNQYIRPPAVPKEAYPPADKKPVSVSASGRQPQPARPAPLPPDPVAQLLLARIVDRDIAEFLSPRQSRPAHSETLWNN